MTTLSCPRCHQLVDSQAINCPYCRTTFKAYGHPGIPLYRSMGDEYLCETCVYHQDDSCNFPKRPYAQDCTLYQNCEEHKLALKQHIINSGLSANFENWVKRHQGLVLVIALLFVCLLITLLTS